MFPYWRIGWRKEKVRTLTLDRLLEEHAVRDTALMKVDCEGAEKLIFAGSVEALSKHRIRAIVLEYHPQIIGRDACRSIHQMLKKLDYRALRVARPPVGMDHPHEHQDRLNARGLTCVTGSFLVAQPNRPPETMADVPPLTVILMRAYCRSFFRSMRPT